MQIHEYIIQNRATTTVALNFFNPIVGRVATLSCDRRRGKYDTRRFSHSLSPLAQPNPIESTIHAQHNAGIPCHGLDLGFGGAGRAGIQVWLRDFGCEKRSLVSKNVCCEAKCQKNPTE